MLRTSFHLLIGCAIGATACGGSGRPAVQTTPFQAGDDACTVTFKAEGRTTTIRTVREGKTLRALADTSGDGQPDEQRVSTFDGEGRLATVDTLTLDDALRQREQRTYDQHRLVRSETDRFNLDGSAGVDGTPDEALVLTWEGDRLVREDIDQLAADGLPGIDGKPEFVTTWTWDKGRRVRGTRVDARDKAVLWIETLDWDGDHIAKRSIDLGGDGTADIRVTNTWKAQRLSHVRIDGSLDPGEIQYEYCD